MNGAEHFPPTMHLSLKSDASSCQIFLRRALKTAALLAVAAFTGSAMAGDVAA